MANPDVKKVNDLARRLETDDADFHATFLAALDLLDPSASELAKTFSTSITTIERWRTGKSTPHPIGRAMVYKELLSRLRQRFG